MPCCDSRQWWKSEVSCWGLLNIQLVAKCKLLRPCWSTPRIPWGSAKERRSNGSRESLAVDPLSTPCQFALIAASKIRQLLGRLFPFPQPPAAAPPVYRPSYSDSSPLTHDPLPCSVTTAGAAWLLLPTPTEPPINTPQLSGEWEKRMIRKRKQDNKNACKIEKRRLRRGQGANCVGEGRQYPCIYCRCTLVGNHCC